MALPQLGHFGDRSTGSMGLISFWPGAESIHQAGLKIERAGIEPCGQSRSSAGQDDLIQGKAINWFLVDAVLSCHGERDESGKSAHRRPRSDRGS